MRKKAIRFLPCDKSKFATEIIPNTLNDLLYINIYPISTH